MSALTRCKLISDRKRIPMKPIWKQMNEKQPIKRRASGHRNNRFWEYPRVRILSLIISTRSSNHPRSVWSHWNHPTGNRGKEKPVLFYVRSRMRNRVLLFTPSLSSRYPFFFYSQSADFLDSPIFYHVASSCVPRPKFHLLSFVFEGRASLSLGVIDEYSPLTK